MNYNRLKHTLHMCMISSPKERAEYIKKKKIFHHMGDNCMMMFRIIPLYPELISIGNNVWIASGVSFVTHDVIHSMLNNYIPDFTFQEKIGCIVIKDNVFIGAGTTIMSNVSIGPNVVVGAGSLINKSLAPGGVYAGIPAKYICSLEEFVEKRKKDNNLIVKKRNEELSVETVKQCWKCFIRDHS